MKIKVLLFANLVLAGLAIVLYLNRPHETAVAPVVHDKTSPPENEVVSNVPSQQVHETKSNNAPKQAAPGSATRPQPQ
jgi:hypothetical protein